MRPMRHSSPSCTGGSPRPAAERNSRPACRLATYWIGVAVFAAVMLATGALARARDAAPVNGPRPRSSPPSLWCSRYQLGNYFRRNRPGRYRPDAIPRSVLPRV